GPHTPRARAGPVRPGRAASGCGWPCSRPTGRNGRSGRPGRTMPRCTPASGRPPACGASSRNRRRRWWPCRRAPRGPGWRGRPGTAGSGRGSGAGGARPQRVSFDPMYVRLRLLAAVVVAGGLSGIGCSNPLARQYEYSEQLYLDVDGSAELVIDSSIAAFVALRNLPLDPSPDVPVDREAVALLFAEPACGEVTVNRPWRRHGRRFVQVVLEQADVRQ